MDIDKFKPYLFDLSENRNNFKDFLKELETANCVVLVGAGLSTPLKIPDWEKLTQNLSEFSKLTYSKEYIKANPAEWSDIAEEAKSYWRKKDEQLKKYYEFLKDAFTPRQEPYRSIHTVLLQVNFLSYLTTNFDNILDKAAESIDNGKIINGIQVFPNIDATFLRGRKIFYLHGKIENQDIVLTKSEYEKAYKYERLKNVLWNAYFSMSIVMIGHSLRDIYIQKLLENFKEQLNKMQNQEQQWKENINKHKHFIFVGVDLITNEEKMKEENSRYEGFNIYPIRYLLPQHLFGSNDKDDHINLFHILEELPKYEGKIKYED